MFPGTLSKHAQNTLALLGKQDFLKNSYLAGGSSLALQLGHRKSNDFDFFSEQEFDSGQINKELKVIGTYFEESQTPKTMVGQFNNVRFSLFHYPYKLVAPITKYNGVSLASPKDIAAMKLVAITDRGTKKDFIDLYFLANRCFSFEKMLEYYDKKYQLLSSNLFTLIKSLQFYYDADNKEMPEMIEKVDWEKIKEFFRSETLRLAEKYI